MHPHARRAHEAGHHAPEVQVPLSEHEQRMLDEMERALYAEDPTFGSGLHDDRTPAVPPVIPRGRLLAGGAGVLAGLGLVVTAIMTKQIWLGAVAFAVMLAALWYTTRRTAPTAVPPAAAVRDRGHLTVLEGGAGSSAPRRQSDFMTRLEQRWDDRRERGGQI